MRCGNSATSVSTTPGMKPSTGRSAARRAAAAGCGGRKRRAPPTCRTRREEQREGVRDDPAGQQNAARRWAAPRRQVDGRGQPGQRRRPLVQHVQRAEHHAREPSQHEHVHPADRLSADGRARWRGPRRARISAGAAGAATNRACTNSEVEVKDLAWGCAEPTPAPPGGVTKNRVREWSRQRGERPRDRALQREPARRVVRRALSPRTRAQNERRASAHGLSADAATASNASAPEGPSPRA